MNNEKTNTSDKTYHLPVKRVKILGEFVKNRAIELLNI